METRYGYPSQPIQQGLKPTYEGWKQISGGLVDYASESLKPTYEGWKREMGRL